MREEEIIKEVSFIIKWISKIGLIKERKAIQGLLDLYNKEKEKNKKVNEINFRVNKNLLETAEKLEQEKEKNKELGNTLK
jgi:hypothetical protein